MEMPQIGDAHRNLHRLAGTWVGEERMHPSPWDPKGGMAKGKVENRVALDGFALVQDYEQERDGKVGFRGHAVFSWDPFQKNYTITWWDSMGFPGHEFRGTFEGSTLKYESRTSQGLTRAVFVLKDNDHYEHTMEVSPDGQNWAMFMEGSYTRVR